ncbi:hypothetical protein GTR04_7040 [Trichophyton interdigitale]|uniref:Uncharacterized protein n=1 Tax=Trichophyton interdigitale TaxID=101480 RepID=A0A9P4YFC6_9EURO|nr:hypothetical protein GY632_3445 [Trichophyton interdigitale]KAF3896191.1 hypothetical protein GY631_2180 [Trichophyton interdigitale]KAG8205577.1 hypothetical protein GTR04_7040 [Trichophyton interdigitale]
MPGLPNSPESYRSNPRKPPVTARKPRRFGFFHISRGAVFQISLEVICPLRGKTVERQEKKPLGVSARLLCLQQNL